MLCCNEVHMKCPSFISVTVSVLAIEGTDCRLDELGRLADRTGGTVRCVCDVFQHLSYFYTECQYFYYAYHSSDVVVCVFRPLGGDSKPQWVAPRV